VNCPRLHISLCGIRTTGDLVVRMQMSRAMKNKEAKEYVSDKLAVSASDLSLLSALSQMSSLS